jgi:YD repeat-containing protein
LRRSLGALAFAACLVALARTGHSQQCQPAEHSPFEAVNSDRPETPQEHLRAEENDALSYFNGVVAYWQDIKDKTGYPLDPASQQEMDDAQLGADALSGLIQDEQLGSRPHYAPYQDGVILPDGMDPNAYYVLGNQPAISVPLGPIQLTYAGARVGLSLAVSSSTTYVAALSAFSGWLPDMLVDINTPNIVPLWDSRALLKGDIYADVTPVAPGACTCTTIVTDSSTGATENDCRCDGNYIYRYRYVDARGATHAFVQTPAESQVVSHYGGPYDPLPTKFWSQDGQMSLDLTNPCLPLIKFPDGTTEEFHFPKAGLGFTPGGFYHHPVHNTVFFDADPNPGFAFNANCDPSAPLRRVDRNGNVLTFTFPDANTRQMQDPQGRSITLRFTPASAQTFGSALLSSVTVDGAAGLPLTWTVSWTPLTLIAGSGGYDFTTNTFTTGTAFADIQLGCAAGTLCGNGAPQTVWVVQSVLLPDGRSYGFQYGPWGNLTRVSKPDGAVMTYQYGSQAAPASYAAAVTALLNQVGSLGSCGVPAFTAKPWSPVLQTLQEYGEISEKLYPQGDGAGQTPLVTSLDFQKVDLGICSPDLAGGATAGPQCCVQIWKSLTLPDGSRKKEARCAASASYAGVDGVVPHGWLLGEEIWAPGGTAPLSASYHGNPATGQMYQQYEVGGLSSPGQCTRGVGGNLPNDRRSTAVVSLLDGITTTTTFTYGDFVNAGGAQRSTLNQTADCIWMGSATSCTQGTGSKLVETDTSWQRSPDYDARQLLRLPADAKVLDAAGTIWSRRTLAYDEVPLAPSGQAGLDTAYTNSFRGNPTTVRTYRTPTTGAGSADSRTYYFDNGATQKTQNPNDLAAGRFTTSITAFNVGSCSANPTLATTVANALGQTETVVKECYTLQPVSARDLNGQLTCTQYDGFGRQVETAVPGDTLSAQPQCTSASAAASCWFRDQAGCAGAGTAIGNGGAGPTTWTEYFPFGLAGVGINQSRSVVHTKDGSPSGRYVKHFVDGLGRPIETCAKIDGSRSSGAAGADEACTSTAYDAKGRVYQTSTPFYATDTASAGQPPPGTQFTQSCYDALDRITATAFIWGGASWSCGGVPPATSFATATTYGSSAGSRLTVATDARGNQTQSLSDALGHVIEVDQFLCSSSPCTSSTPGATLLATKMQYDPLGQLLSSTDPQGNVMSFSYDGLGRKTGMTDPDMGSWSYRYDDNGNLIGQTDAKGQVISMYYDALNRVTVTDLPPAGPGREDLVNTYDGVLPTCAPMPCAAWSAGSTGVCCDDHNPATTDSCDPATVTCNAVASPFPGVCVPGTTRTLSCGFCGAGTEVDVCSGSGSWVAGTCNGGGECQAGSTRTLSCGNCGTEVDTCSPTCHWSAGTCGGQGVCAAGATRSLSCGNCGSETDTCTASCQWSAGACSAQGVCAAGATRTFACGNCGSETDTCTASCQWTAGACGGQGVCAPGSGRSIACGNCGSESDVCSASCQWTAGSCNAQGVCSPATTRSEACVDPLGLTGNETDTCSASCQWANGSCACTPGTVSAVGCDPTGICANCTGTCTGGTRTCSASGSWGACTVAHCTPPRCTGVHCLPQ